MDTIAPKRFFIMLVLCAWVTSFQTNAQPNITYSPLITNLAKPINIKNAGDGSGRLFIVEQSGLIKIYKNGTVLPRPFLDIRNIIDTGVYEGVWSIAFPADYSNSKYFFVYFNDKKRNTVLARFSTSSTDPDSAIANSGVVLFSISTTGNKDPHLGEMHFGPDGYLYISINDGSTYEIDFTYSQLGDVFYGKMLRLDIKKAGPPYYKIPPGNPFINDATILDEIWAMGARNFWRWSFDRKNGNMWIGEDGGDRWDEINVRKRNEPGGANFGWPCFEGMDTFNLTNCKRPGNYVFPVYTNAAKAEYNWVQAIIGGYVYWGNAYPSLRGYYICSDFYTNEIWKMIPARNGELMVSKQTDAPPGVASYGEGEDGELYAASLVTGTVYKVGVITETPVVSAKQEPVIAFINGIKIYPTVLSSGTIYIESPGSIRAVSLTDISGRILMQQKLNGLIGKTSVDLPSFIREGMYMLHVEGTKKMVQKIYVSRQ